MQVPLGDFANRNRTLSVGICGNYILSKYFMTTQLLTDLLITVRTFHMFLLQLGPVM
jgi:hypothetical protein